MTARRLVLRLARALAAWRSSPRGERLLFAEAWWRLLCHDLAFRRHRTGARVPRGTAPFRATRGGDRRRLLAVFDRAVHNHVGRVACLPRSLALRDFLGRHGVETTLRLGVRRSGAGVEGHAWLEDAGEPVGEGCESLAAFARLHMGSEDGGR